MIKVSIARLEKEPIDLDGEEPSSLLDIPDAEEFKIAGPVKYHLHCQAVSQGVLVTGKLSIQVEGICGRCLAHVKSTVSKNDFEMFFEDTPEDELELTEDVRTEMILALPMNLLCSATCKGLCPVCGVDRNHEVCSCDDGNRKGSPAWGALDDLTL